MMRRYTREAKRNLLEGAKKMEQEMTPAARVRREFRLGRPPKAATSLEPLHPLVVWNRATEALTSFRGRMKAAKLNPNHVDAVIVFIEAANPDTPRFLELEQKQVLKQLGRADVIALGMLFKQFDAIKKQQAIFPHLFMGLNERGMAVLKKAAEIQNTGTRLTKTQN
jgi:hypothetical protein